MSDLAYDNRTGYNPNSGDGALGVEFAGTAVSSPSSFGYNSTANAPYPAAYYNKIQQQLVNATGNEELQWTEGATRGYCKPAEVNSADRQLSCSSRARTLRRSTTVSTMSERGMATKSSSHPSS